MKRETIQHIVGIVGCLPLLLVVGPFLISEPRQFNPWAKGVGIHLWVYLLPLLIGTVVCLSNSITGLVLSSRASC